MTLLLSRSDLGRLLDIRGLPWQDLALAWVAYRAAQEAGLGRPFDFLG